MSDVPAEEYERIFAKKLDGGWVEEMIQSLDDPKPKEDEQTD
jgi:hypothetical protein